MAQVSKYIILFIFSFMFAVSPAVLAEAGGDTICAVYLTGIGCPNCAFTDPFLLTNLTAEHPGLVVIEYEIYRLQAQNQETAGKYFENYILSGRSGVPFLIFDKEKTALGRFQLLESGEIIEKLNSNKCPMPDGSSIAFEDIDIANLPGKVKIWTKNRVLIAGSGGDNEILKKIIAEENLAPVREEFDFQETTPEPVPVSDAFIEFENAVKISDWTLQWNEEPKAKSSGKETQGSWLWILAVVLLVFVLYFVYRRLLPGEGLCKCFNLTGEKKDYLIVAVTVLILLGFFVLAKNISPEFLENLGYALPLPVFTFFIALIDGFNPCNMFVLTFLLALLVAASHSRKRIYIVGFTFVVVVFFVYFLFMIAWLNIFKYIGFIDPLRIALALVALSAGIINCKELLFFRKGVTLMIQEQHKGPLMTRIENMKEVIMKGSLGVLITSSIGLALFASLVELPCTAGFPIIYTGILSEKMLDNTSGYYFYLLLYNMVYVLPLTVIITLFGYTFSAKKITRRQMQIIKFVGGAIMIMLGIILLVNPGLIGIGVS